MRIDDPLYGLGEFPPMPAIRDTRWEPVDLDWDSEVRVIDPLPEHPTFTDHYDPPAAVDEELVPVGRLRHRQSWAERHRQDVDDLRIGLAQAQTNLRDVLDGCHATHYHTDVVEQIEDGIDRVVAALRLMDIHDPE